MADIIEMTTAPARLPKRVRRQIWLMSGFFLVVIGLQTAIIFLNRDMTMEKLLSALHTFPKHIIQKDPFDALLYFVLFPIGGTLAVLSTRMSLRITPLEVEFSSRIPSWLKFIQPDWRIERSRFRAVRVDLSRAGATPAAARLRFEYDGGKRVIQLFRWYRVGQDVEGQVTSLWRARDGKGLVEQLPDLAIVRALKEAGIEPTVDTTPVVDPLRKSPAGMALVAACLGAMLYALVTVSNQSDLYAGQPPWLFIGAVVAVAGFLAWQVLHGLPMPQDHKLMGVVAAAAMFGLAAWAAAPQINARTSGGPQQVEYRYDGNGVFEPLQADAPTLDLSRYVRSLQQWKPGDRVTLTLRHGVLGFWQYDRDIAINALDKKRDAAPQRSTSKPTHK